MDDFQSILENGISFKGSSGPKKEEDKVKTKAKKKKYITGAHGSGSARQKAKYREQRANRHSRKRWTMCFPNPFTYKRCYAFYQIFILFLTFCFSIFRE